MVRRRYPKQFPATNSDPVPNLILDVISLFEGEFCRFHVAYYLLLVSRLVSYYFLILSVP